VTILYHLGRRIRHKGDRSTLWQYWKAWFVRKDHRSARQFQE